jgi:hypothetical protein
MSEPIRVTPCRRWAASCLAASVALTAWIAPAGACPQAPPAKSAAEQAARASAPTDLDTFMQRVLLRRDENWRRLHDYILSETETFSIDGPGQLPLNGFRREYAWYVRDGYLVRSPVRFDGVTIAEAERRKYEADWLRHEQAREKRARSRASAAGAELAPEKSSDVPSLESLASQRNEPRFISESYFLRFNFEPGNYYLAGRERFEGRDVLRIEYYPGGLFGEKTHLHRYSKPEPGKAAKPQADSAQEQEIERKLNKVSLITLWVDPSEYQIVKYTFDNTELDFLPGRWLVRAGDVVASMTMSRVLDGVWLPSQVSMHVDLAVATGTYTAQYTRRFHDYKKAEVGARIRIQTPERP